MDITPKQTAVLRLIQESISKNGIAPTLKELRVALKAKSDQAVVQFLDRLEKNEFISRSGQRKARKILLTNKGYLALGIEPPQQAQAGFSPAGRSALQNRIYE